MALVHHPDLFDAHVSISPSLWWDEQRLGALPVLARVLRGAHTSHGKVEMYRAAEVEVQAVGPDPLFFQLDGELHEPPDARSLSLRVVPGALPVLVGSEGV